MKRSALLACAPLLVVTACVDDAAPPAGIFVDAGSDAGPEPQTDASAGADAGSSTDAATGDASPGDVDVDADAATGDAGPGADAGPPPVVPPLLSPILWLDARKVPPGAGASKIWRDASGNGFDATGAVALSVAPAALAGRPAMYFPGQTDQGLKVSPTAFNFQVNDGFAVFVVAQFAKPVAARTAQAVFVDRSSFVGSFPNSHRLGMHFIADATLATLTGGVYTTSPSALTTESKLPIPDATTKPHVYAFVVSNKILTVGVDTAKSAPSVQIAPQDFSSSNAAPLTIGGYGSTGHAQFTFSGHIGEVVVYNRNLSPADVTLAIAKLREDWGIP